MRHVKHLWVFGGLLFLLGGLSSSSWAWWRGGWHGRFGVYVGPGWGYTPYDPYYDPYYYPYYPYPYAYPYSYPYEYPYAPYATTVPQETHAISDNSRRTLKTFLNEAAKARDQVQFELQDGDITEEQEKSSLERIDSVEKEARDAAAVNGGYLTGKQNQNLTQQLWGRSPVEPVETMEEPTGRSQAQTSTPAMDTTRRDPQRVFSQIVELRALLAKKLSSGDITRAQSNAMSDYIDRIERQVQTVAKGNGGYLNSVEEDSAEMQIRQADASIRQNFILQ